MRNKLVFAPLLFFSLQTHATLTYHKTQQNETLLVYTLPDGNTLQIFDHGLDFHYDADVFSNHRSPDRLFAMVPFSVSGTLFDEEVSEQAPVTLNLCAFVRLNDGCITSVATGSQCGGDWAENHRWSSSLQENNAHLFENKTKIKEVYENYASRTNDGTRLSSPRVLSYLLEGTAFDNLLACDPPTPRNRNIYIKLRERLQSEGDFENSSKINSKIDLLPDSDHQGE